VTFVWKCPNHRQHHSLSQQFIPQFKPKISVWPYFNLFCYMSESLEMIFFCQHSISFLLWKSDGGVKNEAFLNNCVLRREVMSSKVFEKQRDGRERLEPAAFIDTTLNTTKHTSIPIPHRYCFYVCTHRYTHRNSIRDKDLTALIDDACSYCAIYAT